MIWNNELYCMLGNRNDVIDIAKFLLSVKSIASFFLFLILNALKDLWMICYLPKVVRIKFWNFVPYEKGKILIKI